MPNLLAYAFGLNPMVPTNNPLIGDIDTGHLRLTVARNPAATDISYYAEIADNLTTPAWTTNGITVGEVTDTSTGVVGKGFTVTATTAVASKVFAWEAVG